MKKTTLLSVLAIFLSLAAVSQVGIGTTDPKAMLDVSSTTSGMLVPRMTQAERNAIVSPEAGLLIYQTDNTPGFYYNAGTTTAANWLPIQGLQGTAAGQMLYFNGSVWVTVAPGSEGKVLTFIGGVPTWAALPGPVTSTTGKIWMDRNLGASRVATSSYDAASYGDLYQWGRAADGHQIRTSGTIATLSSSDTPGHGNFILAASPPFDWRSPQNNALWQGVSGVNNPCPVGYRLPTYAEWEAERVSWSSSNSAGAFASPLKLPVAGIRNNISGSLSNVGSFGYYWSGTVDGTYSQSLFFGGSIADIGYTNRAYGRSVRCLKD